MQALGELQKQLQPQIELNTEPEGCTGAAGLRHAWLSAALNTPDVFKAAAGDAYEGLPSAVHQQLQYKAQRSSAQPVHRRIQRHHESSSPPLHGSETGAELDIGACMAALDAQGPNPPATNGAVRPQVTAAVGGGPPVAAHVHEQPALTPAVRIGSGPGHAPTITGVFARREKRKSEADSRRRANKAAKTGGAGDLSFFMQLRKPGNAATVASTDPELSGCSDDDSADSSLGAVAGADGSTQLQARTSRPSIDNVWSSGTPGMLEPHVRVYSQTVTVS